MQEAAPLGTALAPTPVPGKSTNSRQSHPCGVQCPQHGIPLADGIGGQELDDIALHCGTTRGFVSCSQPAPPALPLPLLCARRWRGREKAQSRRDVPSVPTSHVAKCPDDLV